MGNLWSFVYAQKQPRELRVIFVFEDKKSRKHIYPLTWPDTFAQFVLELHEIFPATKLLKEHKFIFRGGCEFPLCVCNESTFQALIPKHKETSPGVHMYYVTLEAWVLSSLRSPTGPTT